jgi:hypothetical protein
VSDSSSESPNGPWFIPYAEAKLPVSWPAEGWCEIWREVEGGFMYSIEPTEGQTRRRVFCTCDRKANRHQGVPS